MSHLVCIPNHPTRQVQKLSPIGVYDDWEETPTLFPVISLFRPCPERAASDTAGVHLPVFLDDGSTAQ